MLTGAGMLTSALKSVSPAWAWTTKMKDMFSPPLKSGQIVYEMLNRHPHN